ncbi:hypothetical protein B0H13DRAFT_1960258 [Mycena leptocephala]|nr:hypothetical protein B0H13DRAFT_1960258 [Mycena leptocephala]
MRFLSLSSLLAAVAAPLALLLTNSTNVFDLKAITGENLETDLGHIHTLLPTLPAVNADFILATSPPFAITA